RTPSFKGSVAGFLQFWRVQYFGGRSRRLVTAKGDIMPLARQLPLPAGSSRPAATMATSQIRPAVAAHAPDAADA
ncbi:hypothetical protein Q3O93_09690, partial [Ralstonia pseudosolanacearum]|uniref:hypothetical protein n=1 Tax=Ralstonia pseudosolanacearum TaxID=1310165 RepID=UPI0026774230